MRLLECGKQTNCKTTGKLIFGHLDTESLLSWCNAEEGGLFINHGGRACCNSYALLELLKWAEQSDRSASGDKFSNNPDPRLSTFSPAVR